MNLHPFDTHYKKTKKTLKTVQVSLPSLKSFIWAGNHNHYLNLFHTVAFLRFQQSSYSQSESISPLSVNLVLDATSGTTTQAIVAQIAASAQAAAGDTATGKAK